ncbi:Proteasome subunit alpha type-2 [Podila clonocystis]|nr:Proteasome subunit alpha type-2 [Podila clonocystis]
MSTKRFCNAPSREDFNSSPEKLAKNTPGDPDIAGAVYIRPTARIDPNAKARARSNDSLARNVSIGLNIVVGKGTRIRDPIILDNVDIKQNACILYAIIGWDSKVGSWSRVEGTLPSAHNGTAVTKNGLQIQSVTILDKEVLMKDEITVLGWRKYGRQ